MSRGARPSLSSLRRVALAALLALASNALLPWVHALTSSCRADAPTCGAEGQAPSHSADCPVCSAIAHAGARTLDAPSAVAAVSAPLGCQRASFEHGSLPPRVERDPACARGPPASLRSA